MVMIDFIKENYEWLFSGIGVTMLAWVLALLKKAVKKKPFKVDNSSNLLNKQFPLPPKHMEIINEDGTTEKVEVILAFEFKDTKREYVVYTQNDKDKYGNVTAYVSEVDRTNGNPRLIGISNDRQWQRVRRVLKELAESTEEQPLFDEYGIEII